MIFGESLLDMRIILASKSPRRREILSSLGLKFDIIVADADEHSDEKDPKGRVAALAAIKGRAVLDGLEDKTDTLIIASDTLVYAEGEFLGKPRDRDDARRMIGLLSGRSHAVVSGLYLYYNGKEVAVADETRVVFDKMTDGEIEGYISTDEPYDKAGGYGIQGIAGLFVSRIDGDYNNVVGLPLCPLDTMMWESFGLRLTDFKK